MNDLYRYRLKMQGNDLCSGCILYTSSTITYSYTVIQSMPSSHPQVSQELNVSGGTGVLEWNILHQHHQWEVIHFLPLSNWSSLDSALEHWMPILLQSRPFYIDLALLPKATLLTNKLYLFPLNYAHRTI